MHQKMLEITINNLGALKEMMDDFSQGIDVDTLKRHTEGFIEEYETELTGIQQAFDKADEVFEATLDDVRWHWQGPHGNLITALYWSSPMRFPLREIDPRFEVLAQGACLNLSGLLESKFSVESDIIHYCEPEMVYCTLILMPHFHIRLSCPWLDDQTFVKYYDLWWPLLGEFKTFLEQ